MTDNIIDRDELQEKLIQWDLSQMSLDDLKEYFVNMQNAELDSLSIDELIEEVQHYNPQLLINKWSNLFLRLQLLSDKFRLMLTHIKRTFWRKRMKSSQFFRR